MKHSLYLKFLLCYLFFGITGFVAVATLSSRLTYSYLTRILRGSGTMTSFRISIRPPRETGLI